MKETVLRRIKRRISMLLVTAMVIGLLPVTNLQEVKALEAGAKSINYGTGILSQPASAAKRWDKVYFGRYSNIPILWRVLSKTPNGTVKKNEEAYSGSSLLLLSEYTTKQTLFGGTGAQWISSDVRSWLQDGSGEGFASETNFSQIERNLVLKTTKEESGELFLGKYHPSSLDDDTFFLLSAQEIYEQNGFGAESDSDRKAREACRIDETTARCDWMLRNKIDDDTHVGVNWQGAFLNCKIKELPAKYARPACNIALENILFTSTVNGKAGTVLTATESPAAVTDVTDRDNPLWKFTIKNDFQAETNTEGQRVDITGITRVVDTVTVAYNNAKYGANQYISAIITDQNDALLYYGKIKEVSEQSASSGSASFTLPEKFSENGYKLKIFSEEAYSNGTTDYASTPQEVTVPKREITSIDLSPQNVSVNKAESADFSVVVHGVEGYTPSQEVAWSIENQTSAQTVIAATSISSAQLTVGADETSVEIKVTATSTEDVAYSASTTAIPLQTVKLNLDGGNMDPEVESITDIMPGTQITVPIARADGGSYDLVRGRAEFGGWYTERNGEGTLVDNGENRLTVWQDTELFASWKAGTGIGDFKVIDPGNKVYTGKAIKPTVSVYHGDELLTLGKDYSVTYSNNINVADRTSGVAPTITVKGKGNYKETETIRFTISPKAIDADDISIACADKDYTGKTITSDPVVKWGSKKLKKGTDYAVEYLEDETARMGSASGVITCKVKIVGMGNFAGSKEVTFHIVPKGKQLSAKTITIDKIPNQTYTGKEINLTTTGDSAVLVVKDTTNKSNPVTLTEGTDYEVSYPADHTNVGKVQVVLTGKGNYAGTKKATFSIVAKQLNQGSSGACAQDININTIPAQTYTGQPVVIKDGGIIIYYEGNDQLFRQGIDFSVKYSNNTNVNAVKVADVLSMPETSDSEKRAKSNAIKKLPTATITGKGNYSGTIKAYFDIAPMDLATADITVTVPEMEAKKDKSGSYIAAEPKLKNIVVKNNITGKVIPTKELKITGYERNAAGPTAETDPETGAVVIISGSGANCANSRKVPFRIFEKKNLNDITVSLVTDETNASGYIYKGSAYTVGTDSDDIKLEVKDSSNKFREDLILNKDYSIKMINNMNAATATSPKPPTIILKGKGSYAGEKRVPFTIRQQEIDDSTSVGDTTVMEAIVENAQYTGKAVKPKVKVIHTPEVGKTIVLKNGRDYTLEYSDNVNVSETAKVKITGKGNYAGSVDKTFRIYGTSISKAVTTKLPMYTYTGKQIKPSANDIKVYYQDKKLVQDVDYTIRYADNTKAGTGNVYIDGKGAYGGTKTIKFTILPKWLSWIVGGDVDSTEPTENEVVAGAAAITTDPVNSVSEKVTSVTIVLRNGTEATAGSEVDFEISVSGEAQIDRHVILSIVGAESENTSIKDITYNEEKGKTQATLVIGADESAKTIKIVATSKEDPNEGVSESIPLKSIVTFDATYVFEGASAGKEYKTEKLTYGDLVTTVKDADLTPYNFSELKPEKAITVTTVNDRPYEFIGWFTKPDGEGTQFTAETPVTKSMTVYAAWSSKRLGEYSIIDIGQRTYTGSQIKPTVTVFDGNVRMTPGKDYTLSYKNNVNVGSVSDANAPCVTVKGKGNYAKSEVVAFTIAPKNIDDDDISVTIKDKTYTSKAGIISSDPIVKWGKKTLKKNTDYVVNYDTVDADRSAVGTSAKQVKMTIAGIGNYQGAREESFLITDAAKVLNKAKVGKLQNKVYNGKTQNLTASDMTGKVTLNNAALTFGTDYEISYPTEPMNAGKVNATIVGVKDNDTNTDNTCQYGGTKAITYNILPKSMASETVTIDAIPTQKYCKTGVKLTDKALIVRDSESGTVLKAGTDYTVAYKNNKAANAKTVAEVLTMPEGTPAEKQAKGKALAKLPTITITGKGNYDKKTARTAYFDIDKQSMTAPAITVTVKDVKATYKQSKLKAVTPAVVVKDGNTVLKKGKDYLISVSNNTAVCEKYPETAATPNVTVEGIGTYWGTVKVYYRIYDVDSLKDKVAGGQVTVSVPGDYQYNGLAHKPEPVLIDTTRQDAAGQPVVLKKNVDYTITGYKDNINAGAKSDVKAPCITIKGKGSYSGVASCTFDINRKTITADMVTVPDVQLKYDKAGNPVKPDPVVTIVDGKRKLTLNKDSKKDYRISDLRKDDASPSVSIQGTNNYASFDSGSGKYLTCSYHYYETSITKTTTSKIPPQFYTGGEIKPDVVVYYNGKVLTEGVDYTLQYSNNVKIGTGKIQIIGQASEADKDFGGTKTVTFKILPKWLSWIAQ